LSTTIALVAFIFILVLGKEVGHLHLHLHG
jgi:hypothetical protein